MNADFAVAVQSIPALFASLDNAPPLPMKGSVALKGQAGVYVFREKGEVVHVGRTRNLQGRLWAHAASSHNSASFVFKRARRVLKLAATYRPEGSRANLMETSSFREEFNRQREALKGFEVRFIVVPDPVQQYLLELYAHIEYRLPLDEFDTH